MKYADLLTEGSNGMYVRTLPNAKPVIFRNDQGDYMKPIGNVVLPQDGQYFTNDTTDTLPFYARNLTAPEQKKIMQDHKKIAFMPISQQRQQLNTGHANLMLALEEVREANKILPKNWRIIGDKNRLMDCAALVTLWTNKKNETIAYIKLFKSKSIGTVPFFWGVSDFEKATDFWLGDVNTLGKNKQQQRVGLNLKPPTVVGKFTNMSADMVVKQVHTQLSQNTKLPKNVKTQVEQLINNVYSGYTTPVKGAGELRSTYEVDLGETVAPIAIVTGHFVDGAYREAEIDLLKRHDPNLSWLKIKKIRYPDDEAEPLYDSLLNVTDKITIAVSSKDKSGGAAASLEGILRAFTDFPERYKDMESDPKYKNIFADIRFLMDEDVSAIEGPLQLAVKYGIIKTIEKQEIKAAIADSNLSPKNLSPRLKEILNMPIYKPNTKSTEYSVGYHIMANVARLVTNRMNKRSDIVTGFFKLALAKSNLIQVKTKVTSSGADKNDATFTKFTVIWPPVFDKDIKFYCDARYVANARPKGKMQFKVG